PAVTQSLHVKRVEHDATGDARDQGASLGQRDVKSGRLRAAHRALTAFKLHATRVLADSTRQQFVVVEVRPAEQTRQRVADRRLPRAHHADEKHAVGPGQRSHRTCEATNGGFTTRATLVRPRTSSTTSSPSLTRRSSSANPMPAFSDGANVPLVTSPSW